MKIVDIFAQKLFSFHYDGENISELRKILTLWNDTNYLYTFLKKHQKDFPIGETIQTLSKKIIIDAKSIDKTLEFLAENEDKNLTSFFKPLHNEEYVLQLLSKQKGRKNILRIYAIRISEDCFVVTGGAIKLTLRMKEREHTQNELNRLNKCRDFLKNEGIVDEESFFEFLLEQENYDE
jgi:hypothetical protein